MTSKSSAKNTRFSKSRLAFAIAAHMLAAGNALAGPSGGEVVGGVGNINQQGSETTITQTTDRMAIDWQSFDVGKDERVTFVQPGQSAVALNRILSNNGSEILGQIDANGHVILVNPHGVVFGEGAVVNAGGLIASGLQINPDDFMNGDLVFKRIEGTDGTVINAGMINAASGGNVALVGTQVENRGLISARLGSVTLASGKEAVLTFDESGLLGVQVDEAILQSELGDKAAITNSGEINAEGGRILLSASTTRDVFSKAVNWGDQKQARSVTYNEDGSFTLGAGGDVVNSGEITVSGEIAGNIVALGENITSTGKIHADATQGVGGNVELHSNTTTIISEEGIVTAKAEQGGDIKILGKNVGLFDSANVEATGENGGGQILVGGDQEGLNNQIRNADFVYINEKASINASATNSGDGGRAIVFAEDTARIHGNLSARGGDLEGNGGFVETSGKKSFSVTAAPDVSAANGVAGHWLIDPFDIEVISGDGGDDDVLDELVFESGPNASTISARLVSDALSDGTSVTLQTGGKSGDGTGSGNIVISSPIEVTTKEQGESATEYEAPTLKLIAHKDISINANIITKGAGGIHINLQANKSGENGSIGFGGRPGNRVRVITNGGDFKVGDSSKFGAHNLDLSGATIDLRYGVENSGFNGISQSGRLAVYAGNDVIFGDVQVSGHEEGESAEKIIISAEADILINNDWFFDNNPTNVSQGNINNGFSTLKLIAGKNININARMRSDPANQNDTRAEHQDRMHFILSASGDIEIDGEVLTSGGNFTVENSNNFSFQNGVIDTRSRYGAGNLLVEANNNITFGNMPMFSFDSGNTNGSLRNPSLTAEAGGKLNIGGYDLYARETIKLTAAQWEFNSHSLNTVVDSGDIILKSTRGIELPTIASSGFLVVEAENDISQRNSRSSIQSKKEASFLAHGHNVTLTQMNNEFFSVWGEGVNDLNLTTGRSLTLGREGMTMFLDGDLNVSATQGITQLGAIHVVKGKTELATNGDIKLDITPNNFVSVNIGRANTATIDNAAALELTGVQNTNRLNLSVAGDLTQTASVNVDELVLYVAGVTTIANQNNSIDKIAGEIAGGELVVANLLQLGDDSLGLTLSAATTVDASRIAVANVLLSGAATLTFNGVERFNLLQKFEGEDAAVNTVVVNGGDGEREYRISNNATWQEVDLRFNGSGGRDSLLIDDDAVTVALAINAPDAPAGAVVALDIERIEARNGARNTLIGGSSGYEWNISSEFGGTVTAQGSEGVRFINFHELQGGSQDDRFIINDGARMSAIRGGAGNDILDCSGWRGSLDVTIGGSARNVAEIDGIEVLVGNGNGTLQAPDGTNNWTISDGDIGGTFELVENNQMVYRGFNQIKGGSGVDTFVFTLDNKDAQYTLDGGGGNEDSLEFLGGGEGWQGTYGGNNSDATFTFSSPAGSTTVGYRGMESIQLNASLDLMTLTGSQQMDSFHLNPQSWQWNEFLRVSYGGELGGLRIEGNRNDLVQLAGRIHLPEKLELVGGQLKFANDTLLETHELTLENPGGSVGSKASPLDISVEKLTLTEINEDLYLRESNGLMLAGLSGSGTVDLQVLEGDLTQSDASGPINTQGDLLLDAAVGAIRLDRRDNRITGEVSLHAGTAATVYVLGNLRLAGVIAQDVNLQAGDGIRSDKILLVEGTAQFVSEGDITLTAAENNLNQVNVNAGGSVELTDIDRISFVGSSNIEGDLSIHADWLDFLGPTTANTLKADVRVAQVLSPVITRGDALFGSADVTGAWNIISLEGKVQAKSKVTGLERMIEVESLADIDPAIFTDVKNYFYQDISIQLPSDQIYEESDERKPFAGAGNF